MKKFLVVLSIIFVGNFFEVAQAKIETFEGTDSYPITDEKTHGEIKELAKKEAIHDALEKAGVAIFSQTKVENNIITKDIIKVTAGSILKILSDKYKFIPVEEDDGIGMYKATVTISIDTDELYKKLNDFFKRETEEQSVIVKQYEELQKLNNENIKRISELEDKLSEIEHKDPDEDYFYYFYEFDKGLDVPFWRGDKNFPVGYYYGGYFEFVDLKNCKIVYNNGNEYIVLVNIFNAVEGDKGIYKSFQTFKFKKNSSSLPQIYNSEKYIWETLPNPDSLDASEIGLVDYISDARIYEWTTFKIAYKHLFGTEYKI